MDTKVGGDEELEIGIDNMYKQTTDGNTVYITQELNALR